MAISDTSPFTRSVFHPTDFSALSERAFNHALSLALRSRSRFTIAHVADQEPDESGWADFPAVRATLQRWGLLEPGSPRQDVAVRLGIVVEKINVVHRSPLRPIVDLAHLHQTDLVVLGTHGRDGLPRWLRPSVAEPLARRSKTRTLFLPSGCRGFVAPQTGELTLRRVLLAVDFQPDAAAALSAVMQLGELLRPQPPLAVTLLHVGDGEMPELDLSETAHISWQLEHARGDPVTTIAASAAALDTDLIVMTTQGHQGFLDAIRGSTTEQTLRQAPCPLLAVPAG